MSELTPQAAILTAAFSHAPATPAPAPATPATPTAPAIPVEPYSQSGLSPSHAAQWIEIEKENLAQGKISPEEATRRFDSLGATPEQRAPDSRSAEVRLLDQHLPPASPGEYLVRYAAPGQEEAPRTPETTAFDQSARAWLAGAEFPRDIGNSLISQIERVAQQTKHMNADELDSYGSAEFAKLENAYGETLDEKLRAAAVMIDALDKKQPGLKQLLQTRGIGDNALVAAQIIGQSECWHARRKGR